mgnify:CR=1 FL=1
MPNPIAFLALFSWPVVTAILFRRMSIPRAVAASIIWGYLLLPEKTAVDFPLLPAIDKTLIPSLSAAIFAYFAAKSERKKASIAARRSGDARAVDRGLARLPKSRLRGLIRLIVVVLLISPVFTWVSNQAPIIIAQRYIPGLRPYDVASMMQEIAITLLPFWIARHYLRDRQAQIEILRIMAWAGLAYSLPMLVELRMSPQINNWIYGFQAHSFAQHVRQGGYRPMVFLEHGLRVGIFIAMATMAASTLATQATGRVRTLWLAATGWLLLILLLSKNLGATMETVALLPLFILPWIRLRTFVAAAIALLVLCYPLTRGSGLVPYQQIVNFVAMIDTDRASSFEYRLKNEEILLAHANQKPLAGWGIWGRSRVYDDKTGDDISVTDGSWIIAVTVYGWVGYLGFFGLLTGALILLWLRRKSLGIDAIDSAIMLILAANLFDLIPNSSMVPPIWLLAGLCWARLDRQAAAISATVPRSRRRHQTRRSTS